MLGEYFIDRCICASCSIERDYSKYRQLFEASHFILSWYKKEIPRSDVPVEFIDKFDLAHYLTEYRVNQKQFNFDKLINGIREGKLKGLVPYIEANRTDFSDDDVSEFTNLILSKKKICNLISGKEKFQKLLNDIETGNYVDDVEICSRWEYEINRSWTKITEVNRLEAVKDVVSLDLQQDDYNPVETDIREKYNPKNILKTGYSSVDRLFTAGGFERGRLYVIAGTSNVGKSTFMMNLISNAIIKSLTDPDAIFLYLTGENLISESLERAYCCLTGEKHVQMVSRLLGDPTFSLKRGITDVLNNNISNIIMKYFRPGITTSSQLEAIVSEVSTMGNLKAVYLDYLDLTNSGRNVSDTRIDLSYACLDYKQIGVDYKVPFITATPLNRTGYDKDLEPTLSSMSESMKKVDHSDFILFLQPPHKPTMYFPFNGLQKMCKIVKMTVLKNRGGETGDSTQIMMATRLGEEKIFNYRMEELPKTQVDPVVNQHQIGNLLNDNWNDF